MSQNNAGTLYNKWNKFVLKTTDSVSNAYVQTLKAKCTSGSQSEETTASSGGTFTFTVSPTIEARSLTVTCEVAGLDLPLANSISFTLTASGSNSAST